MCGITIHSVVIISGWMSAPHYLVSHGWLNIKIAIVNINVTLYLNDIFDTIILVSGRFACMYYRKQQLTVDNGGWSEICWIKKGGVLWAKENTALTRTEGDNDFLTRILIPSFSLEADSPLGKKQILRIGSWQDTDATTASLLLFVQICSYRHITWHIHQLTMRLGGYKFLRTWCLWWYGFFYFMQPFNFRIWPPWRRPHYIIIMRRFWKEEEALEHVRKLTCVSCQQAST